MKKIAIFASGSGSNAENILNFFKGKEDIRVSLILSNRPDAKVLERAKKFGVKTVLFDKHDFYETTIVRDILKKENIDWIVLAGFLWLVTPNIIRDFPNRIINIHPALLPLFGGKGMYGMRVHEAVVASQEKESGITIHFVNEQFDSGEIIFQKRIPVEKTDTAGSLAKKIHELEYKHYPPIIEKLVSARKSETT